MKIIFLGTGHGVPTAERACSSIMIAIGDAIYLFDAGCPVTDRLLSLGRDITSVKAVFNTHTHSDHVSGIYHLADLINWRYRDSEIDIYLPERRVCDAFENLIEATTRPLDRTRVRFHAVDGDFIYDDGVLRVTLFPTEHMTPVGRPSYGMLIEAEGKRIYVSGDLSQHLAGGDFPTRALSSDIDLFVCELAHFALDLTRPYLDRCRAKRVAFTHVYPLDKYRELQQIKNSYSFELLTPSDMETVII